MARSLQNITEGRLEIIAPTQTYLFPSYENGTVVEARIPRASIVVRSKTFFLRLLASPDIGFAEAYMFGDIDIDTDHLIEVFRVRSFLVLRAFNQVLTLLVLWLRSLYSILETARSTH